MEAIREENFSVEDIIKSIREEKISKKRNPFYTPYYYEFIEGTRKFNKLVLIGAGEYGVLLQTILENNEITSVACFADNNQAVQGKMLHGYEVKSVENAVKICEGACFIITPRLHKMELVRQLVKLGVSIDNIELLYAESLGIFI